MKNKRIYDKEQANHSLPSHKVKNALIAFVSGGILAILSQLIFEILTFKIGIDEKAANSIVILLIIITTSFFTGIGVYDKVSHICGAGLFIPISGFANAMCSSAMEYKGEGLIYGIGSNMFKLTGSVITYGIVSAYIFASIQYLFNL